MAEEFKAGCARPTGGPVGEEIEEKTEKRPDAAETKDTRMGMIKVGRKAPDFTAPAYHKGTFVNVKLSDYLGQWVVLCFYPGDFTFV